MAKLEWAHIESFDAAEHERLNPADIATLKPESTLQIQPHLRLIEVGYEVDVLLVAIRKSAKRGGSAARDAKAAEEARASAHVPSAFSYASSGAACIWRCIALIWWCTTRDSMPRCSG